MKHPRRYLTLAVGLASAIFVVACSGGLVSPVGPTTTGSPNVSGGSTTIQGRMSAMGSTAAVRPSAAPSTIHVCVTGTTTCADVDDAGSFTLTGNFSGDVELQFVGPQGVITLTVPDVQPGETVVVTVQLNGGTSAIRVESRTGSDDLSDDSVSEDDPSEDDPSEDDDSEDSEDTDSEDEDSEDDDSDDSDSEDDESEDDDSEDDDSEDAETVKTGGSSGPSA